MEFSAKQISQFIQGCIEGDETLPLILSPRLKKVRKELSPFLQTLK